MDHSRAGVRLDPQYTNRALSDQTPSLEHPPRWSKWAVLGPKLQGKIHIWVGDADDFFLNNAVHQLDEFLSRAQPAYEGSIAFGHGHGHCWMGISEREMMQQMWSRMQAAGDTL